VNRCCSSTVRCYYYRTAERKVATTLNNSALQHTPLLYLRKRSDGQVTSAGLSGQQRPRRRDERSVKTCASLFPGAPGWWPAVNSALRESCTDLCCELSIAAAEVKRSEFAKALSYLDPWVRQVPLSSKQHAVMANAFDAAIPCVLATFVGLFLLRWALRELPVIRAAELDSKSRPGFAPTVPSTTVTVLLMLGVTYGFYLQCCPVHGKGSLWTGLMQVSPSLRVWPANEWAQVSSALVGGDYWRLVTPVLLHANVLHLAANLRAWWSLRFVETWFGPLGYLLIFVSSAAGGAATSFAFHTGHHVSVGASGAICGLLGADMVVSRPGTCLQALLGLGVLTALSCLVPWLGVLDNWAHWGGLVTGYVVASMLGLLKVLFRDRRGATQQQTQTQR